MTAARSGKLLKVVTSNFRELVASIQGKVEKISPMHLCTAIDPPPRIAARLHAECRRAKQGLLTTAAVAASSCKCCSRPRCTSTSN